MRILHIATAVIVAVAAAACTSAAPSAPTAAPPPPTAAQTTAPKPAVSPAPSAAASAAPSASPAAKPAASPAGSPAASPAASPLAAGSPVAIPQAVLQGTVTPGFNLLSSAFKDGDTFPTQYTCVPGGAPNGATSPPLNWSGAPSTARAFAIVEQDMDVPPPNGPVVHWLIFNIPSTITSLDPGLPQTETLPNGATQGVNSLRSLGYIGSCPPPGAAPHHYVFQLFALDGPITLRSPVTLVDFQPAMQGHIMAQARLGATFGR
jgi:Raf kinase inhibitor-like YbhB/YbcL family protein